MRFKLKKKWDLSLIVIYVRFKGKMSYTWDLNNKTSEHVHITIKLYIYVVLALKSHIWHLWYYIYVDLYFSDAPLPLRTDPQLGGIWAKSRNSRGGFPTYFSTLKVQRQQSKAPEQVSKHAYVAALKRCDWFFVEAILFKGGPEPSNFEDLWLVNDSVKYFSKLCFRTIRIQPELKYLKPILEDFTSWF